MWEHIKLYRELYFGVAWFAVFMLFFTIFVATGFPEGVYDGSFTSVGQPDSSWCERIGPGNIKTPSNTWSNLGFVIAGLLILWLIGLTRQQGGVPYSGPNNLMCSLDSTIYPTMFGNVVMFMGPGSMLYHASLREWAGTIDQISMFLFLGVFCGHSLVQITARSSFKGNPYELVVYFVTFMVVLVVSLLMTKGVHLSSQIPIGIFVFVAILAQFSFIIGQSRGSGFPYTWWGCISFLIAVVVFIVAIWTHTQEAPGEAHCPLPQGPDWAIQYHAWWQILSALMAYGVYWFLRGEKSS